MRIRYAYKLENEKGETKFVVWNWVNREDEVLAKYSSEGFTKVSFHDRVRTGFRMLEDGSLEATGLTKAQQAKVEPTEAKVEPAPTPKASKTKKAANA